MKEAMSYRDAAEMLGVSEMTLRRLVERGVLTPTRIGRRVLFRRADLARLLGAADVSTAA